MNKQNNTSSNKLSNLDPKQKTEEGSDQVYEYS